MNNMTNLPAKSLVVSTEPSTIEGQTVAVNQPAEKKPSSLIIKSDSPVILAQPLSFIGKHVVYSPSTGELTNPIDNKDEAHAFAESIQASGKPAVVMCITAQFL